MMAFSGSLIARCQKLSLCPRLCLKTASASFSSADNADTKHLEKPKRPLSGFMRFSQEKRAEIVEKNPGVKMTEVGALLGQMWKTLPEEEKVKYPNASPEEIEEFKKQTEAYLEALDPVGKREMERSLLEKKARQMLKEILQAPKKPPSAYGVFLKELFAKDKATEKAGPQDKNVNFKKLSTRGSEAWKKLTEEEKKKYAARHAELVENFDRDYLSWSKSVEHVLLSLLPKPAPGEKPLKMPSDSKATKQEVKEDHAKHQTDRKKSGEGASA